MKKKLLSVVLSVAMVASLLVGCGGTEEAAPEADNTEEAAPEAEAEAEEPVVEDTNEVVEAVAMEAPSTEGWDESKKIYAYSWNDEFGSRLQFVLDKYPEYSDYVEYVNLGVSGTDGTYQELVDTAMAGGDKYPSLIAADNDVAKYYTETEDTLTLSSIN